MSRASCLVDELLAGLQLLIEAVDLAFGVDDALLAGEERVAFRAHIGADHLLGRAGRPGVAAGADHLGIRIICGMNIFLHICNILFTAD